MILKGVPAGIVVLLAGGGVHGDAETAARKREVRAKNLEAAILVD